MGIKIRYEKVVDGGKKMIKILGIEALPKEKLPPKYLEGSPNAYKVVFYGGSLIKISPPILYPKGCHPPRNGIWAPAKVRVNGKMGIDGIYVGDTYPPELFGLVISHLRRSGERLRWINNEIREKKKWSVERTITI
jgi:hypothetical protein